MILADLLLLIQDAPPPPEIGGIEGDVTRLHPLGAAALAILSAAAILLPRKLAALPLVALICFIPASQRVVIATIDFTFIRLLIMVLWLRLILRRETVPLQMNALDWLMIFWALIGSIVNTIQLATVNALVYNLGIGFDALALYFFFRMHIRSRADVERIALQFAMIALPVVLCFAQENRTGYNAFSIFGGVRKYTDIRDGRLRCQGAFNHPILAGCFWAGVIPLMMARAWIGKNRILISIGMVASIGIILFCASSTPVMALAFGTMAAGAFLVRYVLRWYLLLFLLWLLVLHFFLMKTPVWHLLARVDLVGGSTGYHRFLLVDNLINRFNDWWAVGIPSTAYWGHGLQDVTDHFVLEAIRGGIWRLVLFVSLIVFSFVGISRALRSGTRSREDVILLWALGVALFMHCMNFIAISYFDEIMVVWYLTLASISSLASVPGTRIPQPPAPAPLAPTQPDPPGRAVPS